MTPIEAVVSAFVVGVVVGVEVCRLAVKRWKLTVRVDRIGDQDVVTPDRPLTAVEAKALRDAFERHYTGTQVRH